MSNLGSLKSTKLGELLIYKNVEIVGAFGFHFRVPNSKGGNDSSLQVGNLSVGASALYSSFYFHFPIVV